MKTKLLTIAMTAALMLTAMTKVQAQDFEGPCLPSAHGLLEDQSAMCGSMQTIALVSGFNWISANVEINLDDLKAALVAALPGTTITINSQSGGSTTYNGSRWRGSLNSLNLSEMYMVETTAAAEMTLEGMRIVSAEHPATIIHEGNNWVAFPLNQSMTLTDAFAGFPVNGDQVISQGDGSSTYNNRWRGTLTNLDPNKGYLYISASPNDRTFTFPENAK